MSGARYGSRGNQSDKLPNTPQCRKYMKHARTAGAMGTYSPLIKHYNACLNSASKNRKDIKKLRCAPGKYYHEVGGVRRCI